MAATPQVGLTLETFNANYVSEHQLYLVLFASCSGGT
jgi:hypothetical protein